jgi:hypothetical protein
MSAPCKVDYAFAMRLFIEEGWTVAALAEMFKVSRWAIHKGLAARGCTFRPKVSVAGRKAPGGGPGTGG